MLYTFFLAYGWQLTLVAIGGIVLIGGLKFFRLFEKFEPSGKNKGIYSAISAGYSILTSGLYLHCVDKFSWSKFAVLAIALYFAIAAVYATYENNGIRAVVRKLGNVFLKILEYLGFVKSNTLANTLIESAEEAENELDGTNTMVVGELANNNATSDGQLGDN